MLKNKKQLLQGMILSVSDGISNWLDAVSFKQREELLPYRWKYCTSMTRPYGLIPTAYAVVIFSMIDKRSTMSEGQKKLIIDYIQSEQDSVDGFFKDSLVTPQDIVDNPIHSTKDIWGQMTGAANKALSVLGARPRYDLPRSFYIIDDDSERIVKDLRIWDWSSPWHIGEKFARSLIAYDNKPKIVEKCFMFYEQEILEPSNGMPTKCGCSDPFVATAGLFKILSAYNYFSRQYPFAEKAVDFVMELQKEDGEFAGNMCLNWDCIWVLRELDHILNSQYRHEDIVKASLALSDFLLKYYRKKDGGFSFCKDHSTDVHHSVYIGRQEPVSDMLGTLMVLHCLFYSDEFLGNIDDTVHSRIKSAYAFSIAKKC